VILVIAWYHMPWSYFLLNAFIPSSILHFQIYPVATGGLNNHNWFRARIGWKLVYSEMVKFWGSIIELIHYQLKGQLPYQPVGKSEFVERLKNVFLLRINRDHFRDEL
jgi:hypothetical protein